MIGAGSAAPAGESDLASFAAECDSWLSARWAKRGPLERADDDFAVFHSLSEDEERALVLRVAQWQAEKFDAGYGAIAWSREFGGSGLGVEHERTFATAESGYDVPADHELRRITTNLVAPTIVRFGSAQLRDRFVRDLLACRRLVCQLFSEPAAGSDLASLATRARRVDDGWVVDGAKVWVSGAQFADFGLLIARTDARVPKHEGLTAFLLPLSAQGVEVRPIQQMSGGSSFNEVFFDSVRIPDSLRVGEMGQGWAIALAMLAYERAQSGSNTRVGGSVDDLLALAARAESPIPPALRHQLVDAFVQQKLSELSRRRADEARACGAQPGATGSLGKLGWSQELTAVGEIAASLLGPRLLADTGEPATFSWTSHVLGAPGFHIAGGTDEIQRNIIGERVLMLPHEPQPYRAVPWEELPR